ncbi:DUF6883 domain-containing protein [Acidithiobacillus thiooxidans]|uniref:DUF6883 domain-containing protein n=1 Tax=Acidithiobacillus thiooxidans TaxID=930 RepID=UPI0034A21016
MRESGHAYDPYRVQPLTATLTIITGVCLRAILINEATEKVADSHGKRYQVDFVMQHQGKSAIVRTGWIIRTGEDVPRLTSCYVRTS